MSFSVNVFTLARTEGTNVSDAASYQQNRILAALSYQLQERILPHLERVPMAFNQVLYGPGGGLRHIYFPTDSVASLAYMTKNGESGSLALVGNEGIVGIEQLVFGQSSTSRASVLYAGSAFRMPLQSLKDELSHSDELMKLLLRYTQALLTQFAQTVACNRQHTIGQQLCRWLLLSLDRLPGSLVKITQEELAQQLGVRREGITVAAGKLRNLGVLDFHQGKIFILNRPQLEALSCECYALVKKESDRLLPKLLMPGPELREARRSSRWVNGTALWVQENSPSINARRVRRS